MTTEILYPLYIMAITAFGAICYELTEQATVFLVESGVPHFLMVLDRRSGRTAVRVHKNSRLEVLTLAPYSSQEIKPNA